MKQDRKAIVYHKKGPGFGTRFSEPWAQEMIEYGSKAGMNEAKYVFPHETLEP